MPHPSLPRAKLSSRPIHLRAKCTGRLRARFTQYTDHSHSRKGISNWICRQERPAAKSSLTQPAEIVAMMDATGKCTKTFSKAVNMRKSFSGLTMWKEKSHRKESSPLRFTEFFYCMDASTN